MWGSPPPRSSRLFHQAADDVRMSVGGRLARTEAAPTSLFELRRGLAGALRAEAAEGRAHSRGLRREVGASVAGRLARTGAATLRAAPAEASRTPPHPRPAGP